jgi:hypothetical protein
LSVVALLQGLRLSDLPPSPPALNTGGDEDDDGEEESSGRRKNKQNKKKQRLTAAQQAEQALPVLRCLRDDETFCHVVDSETGDMRRAYSPTVLNDQGGAMLKKGY